MGVRSKIIDHPVRDRIERELFEAVRTGKAEGRKREIAPDVGRRVQGDGATPPALRGETIAERDARLARDRKAADPAVRLAALDELREIGRREGASAAAMSTLDWEINRARQLVASTPGAVDRLRVHAPDRAERLLTPSGRSQRL